jgi:hypothetical protein
MVSRLQNLLVSVELNISILRINSHHFLLAANIALDVIYYRYCRPFLLQDVVSSSCAGIRMSAKPHVQINKVVRVGNFDVLVGHAVSLV